MAEALLIAKTDVTKYTGLDGNLDYDKLLPFIKIAQDIWVQQYTGTNLLNKIKTEILANTLSGVYLSLTRDYIKPMLIHFTMVEYLPFAAYQISNNGIYQKEAENSTIVTPEVIDSLVQKEKRLAENYAQRFVDYINFHLSSYPEYNNNTNEKIQPQHQNYSTNWYI